jgi:hypothetical protein
MRLTYLDNVDYDELKLLIKERTSNGGTTEPVSIPGQAHTDADAASARLEADLFSILCNQHERVNLFTRSKYGEFERRMDYVDRQARLWAQRKGEGSSRPMQYTRRYGKLVHEAEGVGEDIQCLSRYITTQKQAFRKILKKYRKWTGSSGLEFRMNNEAFNHLGSVLNMDLMPLLDRLEGVKSNLAASSLSGHIARGLRVEQDRENPTAHPQQPNSSASRLHDVFLRLSPLEFDATFSALPLGLAGGRATYWVHQDNLEEVTVLLRRYMKDRKNSNPAFVSRTNSFTSLPTVRRGSTQSDMLKDRTHMSMLDNLRRFLQAQGAVTVGQAEDLAGSVSSMLAMSILWSSEPEAIVVTSDLSPSAAPNQRSMDIAHLKSRDLVNLFESEGRHLSRSSQGSNSKPAASDLSLKVHRDWLAKNRDIKPLAEVQCTRSRFAGLNNTSEVGTWALMDMDIIMSPPGRSTIGDTSSANSAATQSFPHTVLEVRWEFSRTPEIVRALDSTYLVERIRGFSLEALAISTICKPSDMPPPMWQPLLERDIRKVPPLQTRTNLRKDPLKIASSGPSSTDGPSAGAFSTGPIQSSATSLRESNRSTPPTSPLIPKHKAPAIPHASKSRQPKRKPRHEQQNFHRYWNEFDDGDEVPEDERYAIYVSPDENTSFPGAETVSKAFSSMYQSLGRTRRRILSWLPLQSCDRNRDLDAEEGVRRPLLAVPGKDPDQDNEDSSDTDTSNSPATCSKKSRSALRLVVPDGQRTSPSPSQSRHSAKRHHVHISRETVLFRTYLGCYAIAFVLLVMSAIMKTAGRHKAKVQVDAGAIVGVVAALGSAVIGISLMISREENLSWLHRSLGGGAFIVVCVGSGWLLAVIGGSL